MVSGVLNPSQPAGPRPLSEIQRSRVMSGRASDVGTGLLLSCSQLVKLFIYVTIHTLEMLICV